MQANASARPHSGLTSLNAPNARNPSLIVLIAPKTVSNAPNVKALTANPPQTNPNANALNIATKTQPANANSATNTKTVSNANLKPQINVLNVTRPKTIRKHQRQESVSVGMGFMIIKKVDVCSVQRPFRIVIPVKVQRNVRPVKIREILILSQLMENVFA